jgi:hypothetical protein
MQFLDIRKLVSSYSYKISMTKINIKNDKHFKTPVFFVAIACKVYFKTCKLQQTDEMFVFCVHIVFKFVLIQTKLCKNKDKHIFTWNKSTHDMKLLYIFEYNIEFYWTSAQLSSLLDEELLSVYEFKRFSVIHNFLWSFNFTPPFLTF